MAEYLIQSETLAAIGDQIRVLNGTEDNMSPAKMAGDLGDANTEVENQTELINQIASALQGKAGGSGSGGTFTLQIISNDGASFICVSRVYYMSNGICNIWDFDGIPASEIIINDVDINTYIIIDAGILSSGQQMWALMEITSANLIEYDEAVFIGNKSDTIETITIYI